ncbi:hypothetical protein IE077_000986, partial [Cardiosporidium cionae]
MKSENFIGDASDAISQHVLPQLHGRKLIKALSFLPEKNRVTEIFIDYIGQIIKFLEEDPKNKWTWTVLNYSCKTEENIIEAVGQGVVDLLANTLIDLHLKPTNYSDEIAIVCCKIISVCTSLIKKAANAFAKYGIHVDVLIPLIKEIIGEKKPTKNINVL